MLAVDQGNPYPVNPMKEENFHKRTAAFLLSFGLVLSQIPAYATVGGEATASEQANPLVAQAGGVKVRATVDDTPSTNNRGPTRHSSIQQAVEEISGAFKANSVSLEGFVDAKILN